MSYERVSLQFDGKVAVLKFNHQEVLNAIGAQMLGELKEAVAEIANPANQRARDSASPPAFTPAATGHSGCRAIKAPPWVNSGQRASAPPAVGRRR